MAHNLSKERLEHLKKVAESAIPYTDEESAEISFDGECDLMRMHATIAKKLLDQYYAEHGGKPEGEKDT